MRAPYRSSMAASFVALAVLLPSGAWAFDSPRELVEAIYAPYRSGQRPDDVSQFYSERLQQFFAEHADAVAAQADAGVPVAVGASALDFNPFVDGQNALLLDVVIGEPQVIDNQALVTVTFHNFDVPTMLSLSLVREPDGWKVDDVASMGGEQNWMLSWLLQFDPWGL